MSDLFRHAYAELTDFIARHPEIEIGESVTSIPESVRSDFYAIFNSTRSAFVEEKFSECLRKSERLKREYAGAVEEVAGFILMEDSPTVSALRRYLSDYRECLARELFDPLFDLLKTRETLEGFERSASSKIDEVFPILYRGGYERWTVLSLAKLLEVDRALRVPVRELQAGGRAKSAAYAPIEAVPLPVESAGFSFSRPAKAIYAVPDFIVHSTRLSRFVGIRSEFKEGIHHALNASSEREWYPVDVNLLKLLAGGLTLIYVSQKPESIALVADVGRFCRPDLLLWCVDAQTASRKEALEKMEQATARLKPTRGSFIIANDLWPGTGDTADPPGSSSQKDMQVSGIQILTVGFDRLKLMPVIEALCDREN